ncbi:unnamed protein product [Clavelina lepadiformis]|uniref:Uncharacterized protein n=1 Tax=Clavelina lepadiformis TaxID=159417 RepID=A0ABP0G8F7_CLALP
METEMSIQPLLSSRGSSDEESSPGLSRAKTFLGPGINIVTSARAGYRYKISMSTSPTRIVQMLPPEGAKCVHCTTREQLD